MGDAYPRLVSADDHIVEPPDLWSKRLPAKYRDIGPHVLRQRIPRMSRVTLDMQVAETDDGDWADVWHYEDKRFPIMLQAAAAGMPRNEVGIRPTTFDEMRPGCWQPKARVADMDVAGIDAQVCFPNLAPVRFAGQGFLEAKDKELALLCVRAYNDFVLDEWCAGSNGRLVQCGLIPLWDAELATAEVRRTAARGMRAICFSEAPMHLGLPTIHKGYWNPLFQACEETETVVMIHIGSSSNISVPSGTDAPQSEFQMLVSLNAAAAVVDWLFSGVVVDYPGLKVCFAESQVAWLPYYLQRMDQMWQQDRVYMAEEYARIPELPSDYFKSNMYVTFFNDPLGLRLLDDIGEDNVLCETDYPHNDTTWPTSQDDMRKQTEAAALTPAQTEKVIRGNAIKLFRLEGVLGS
jgi:predicted TIM-barrel fold metal-dependent hydrolase